MNHFFPYDVFRVLTKHRNLRMWSSVHCYLLICKAGTLPSYRLWCIFSGIQVEKLSEKRITSSADAQDLLEPARKKLIFAETEMLRQSSRYELFAITLFSSSVFFCQVSIFLWQYFRAPEGNKNPLKAPYRCPPHALSHWGGKIF